MDSTNAARQTTGREHLRALAESHGIKPYEPKPQLTRPISLPQFSSPADHEEATKVLAGARRASEKFKDPSKKLVNRFKSNAKKSNLDRAENWDFSWEERASLLDENVRNSGSIGQAEALIHYRGDNLLDSSNRNNVAAKVVKRVSKVVPSAPATTLDPDEWLPMAVSNNSIQHVVLLASRNSSKPSMTRAFEAAISSNASVAIVEELLRYGVDPNDHWEKTSMLLHQKRSDLLEVFLRSQRALQPVQLNMALAQALDQKDMQASGMLLAYGADPNYAAARGFLDSVKRSDLQVMLLLLNNAQDDVRMRSEYLDHAVSTVVTNDSVREDQRLAFLDALISAGANRNLQALEDELYRAVQAQHVNTIKLLASSGVATDHNDARCIQASLKSQDHSIFDILMQGRLANGNLSKAVATAMSLSPGHWRLHAMKILLHKGTSGPEVSAATIQSIEQEDGKLFQELVTSKAGTDASDEMAIQAAFQAQDPGYLKVLCSKEPFSHSTATRMVPLALHPRSYNEARSQLVIKASSAHSDVLGKALTDEVAVHDAREDIIALLLSSGASVDFSNGAALYQAASKGRPEVVQLLVHAWPAHLSLHSAFRAAMTLTEVSTRFAIMNILLKAAGNEKIGQDDALVQEAKAAPTIGLDIVNLLLKHKASVDHEKGEAMKVAITAGSSRLLELLLSARPGKDTLVAAFAQCMGLPRNTRSTFISMIAQEAMTTAVALPVGLYLEQAITENDLELCKLLLHYGADPNTEHGRAFMTAAQLHDTSIFEELLVYRPDIKRLLPSLIRELHDEDKVVACLGLCFERLHIQLNPTENVLVFLALDQFEEGEKLVKFLLKTGCSAGATRELQLREGSDIESVTPLIWALSRPLPGPTKAVLLALLEKGQEAKPDFVTPVSQTSAILEAAQTGRHAVLSRLLALGAKVNAQDSKGQTALFLASGIGHLASVQAILQARVRPNDGSLHMASKGAYEQIVQLLLDNGHTPNHIHQGRNALAELCLHGHPDGNDWSERAYWVVDVLIKRGTNLEVTFSGKNVLHLALDNDMPVGILKVLLAFPQFSEHLNEDSFLYEDAAGTVFSPVSYAETFYNGTAVEKSRLVKLLEDKNCARNLWNRHGKHPAGYTYKTMPAHLRAMVDQEQLDELKHAKELQRRQEQARVERELADRNHKHLMDQAAARHRHEVMEAQQREAQQAAADLRRQEAEKRHKRELALAEAASLREKHQLEINQQSALATQRQQIEDRDRARIHRHQQEMNALEMQRAADQSRVNEQQHIRQLQLLDKQDQSVRMRANEMRSVAQAAQMANTNVGLAGPSNGPPKQIGFGDDWARVE